MPADTTGPSQAGCRGGHRTQGSLKSLWSGSSPNTVLGARGYLGAPEQGCLDKAGAKKGFKGREENDFLGESQGLGAPTLRASRAQAPAHVPSTTPAAGGLDL